jgi:hypothetical protein
MSGVADPSTIDVVGQDPDGTYLLIMVEDRPWGADPDQAAQLREKINSYAGFIFDGSLVRRYPETEGQPVRIRLDCTSPPSGHIEHIIDHATAQLANHGIGFQVNPRN